MATIAPPKYVRQILFTLQGHGYPAYLVGGCVRDMLLEHRPHDWDICTGALPEQVMALFPGSRPTGLAHGTVTVVIGSRQVEVTTFRTEGSYADHRHPDRVAFVTELTEDLSRRDFTMNAIALAADGLLADPFGGVEDIREKRIRCVGEPALRFEEDALRMLRALRFSAKLGFTIEINTLLAIQEKAPLAATLAAERVREELEKLLLTDAPETVHPLMEMGLLDAYLLDRPLFSPLFRKLRRLPRKALYRWAGLTVLLCRLGCIDSAEDFLRSLRLDSRSIRCCTAGNVSTLRSTVPEALVVCSVENSSWAISAAVMAVATVSGSRISPSRMISGAWRRAERSASAYVATSVGTSRCVTMHVPWRCTYSMGSSMVMMWPERSWFSRSTMQASVVDLPEPAGPVTSTRPFCRRDRHSTSSGIS